MALKPRSLATYVQKTLMQFLPAIARPDSEESDEATQRPTDLHTTKRAEEATRTDKDRAKHKCGSSNSRTPASHKKKPSAESHEDATSKAARHPSAKKAAAHTSHSSAPTSTRTRSRSHTPTHTTSPPHSPTHTHHSPTTPPKKTRAQQSRRPASLAKSHPRGAAAKRADEHSRTSDSDDDGRASAASAASAAPSIASPASSRQTGRKRKKISTDEDEDDTHHDDENDDNNHTRRSLTPPLPPTSRLHASASPVAHVSSDDDAEAEPERRAPPKAKHIDHVQIGNFELATWYHSPYPDEYRTTKKLFVCQYCLKYCKEYRSLAHHESECTRRRPPGKLIYQDGKNSVFEVDGSQHKLYCQCLTLLAKCFIDHKTLFYDVDPFLFYVLTEETTASDGSSTSASASSPSSGSESSHQVVAYFSKEKQSPDQYNLACFPDVDTRVLTDRGFLFLDQILALEAAGKIVQYASYSADSATIRYSQGEIVTKAPQNAPSHLVDFTQGHTKAYWAGNAAAAAHDDDDCGDDALAATKTNHLSLRVTPDHDMFVQFGNRTSMATGGHHTSNFAALRATSPPCVPAELPYVKIPAEELAPGFQCDCISGPCAHRSADTLRFLSHAENGVHFDGLSIDDPDSTSPVHQLGLRTEEELKAFLELYGYWLGDGWLGYTTATGESRYSVGFQTVKNDDFLRSCLKRVGLRPDEWVEVASTQPTCGEQATYRFEIVSRRWFDYFDSEYWATYKGGRIRHGVDDSTGLRDMHNAAKTDDGGPLSHLLAPGPADAALPAYTSPMLAKEMTRMRDGIVPPDVKSTKWFWHWVLKRLNPAQMRLLLEGLRRADAHFPQARDQKGHRLFTSSVAFRDQVIQACLHAGYSATFSVHKPVGLRDWRVCGDGRFDRLEEMKQMQSANPTMFDQIDTNETSWVITFTTPRHLFIDRKDIAYTGDDANQESSPYDPNVDGRLWCVSLPEDTDRLIIAQRAKRDEAGQVIQTSRPVIVGNCILSFPQYQRKGYGKFLIALSYELSRREHRIGSPEKPLSELGRVSYRSYWVSELMSLIASDKRNESLSILDICARTAMKKEDVISALESVRLIRSIRGEHQLDCDTDEARAALAAHRQKERAAKEVNAGLLEFRSDLLHWKPPPATLSSPSVAFPAAAQKHARKSTGSHVKKRIRY